MYLTGGIENLEHALHALVFEMLLVAILDGRVIEGQELAIDKLEGHSRFADLLGQKERRAKVGKKNSIRTPPLPMTTKW